MSLTAESTGVTRRFELPRPAAEALRANAEHYHGVHAAAMVLAAVWVDYPDDAPADVRGDADFLFWADGEVGAHWPARCNLLQAARVWLEAEATS